MGEVHAAPIVRFVNVQKSYDGETLVVRDLNLDILHGEFLTLLGPSGSGKTTSLMMLAGFEIPSHGEIFFKGNPIGKLPPHRRGIGMVFQNYALFPHMTVHENLAYPLQVRRWPRSEVERQVRRVLSMIKLEGYGDRKPTQLSGGQQQRVAVGRALVFDPELVLMDEPLGALDRQLREQMQTEIKQLHGQLGITVIYVTHDQSEAMALSDRIAVFNDGVIQQLSIPTDLYERPQNSFVAGFIGENNRLAGRIESIESEGECLVRLDQGGIVKANAVSRQATGERTTLAIRPERAFINAAVIHDNVFRGRIVELTYLGDHTRVHLEIPSAGVFVVKMQQTAGLFLNAEVVASWSAEDCRALD